MVWAVGSQDTVDVGNTSIRAYPPLAQDHLGIQKPNMVDAPSTATLTVKRYSVK